MIPVFVNVFNRLTTTRKLVDQVAKLDGAVPIIIDNNSTWEPLLEWYESRPCEVVQLRSNLGHHSPWISGIVAQGKSDYYAVTDCDLDLDGVPADALDVLMEPLEWDRPHIIKSGLGLRIDDVPKNQTNVINWESRFWKRRVGRDDRFFWAPVDTTFAVYSAETTHDLAMTVVGPLMVRSGGLYQARHVPWYLDYSDLSDEEKNYIATSGPSASWKPKGNVLGSRHTL